MSYDNFPYKHAITSSHRKKMVKLETDMILDSLCTTCSLDKPSTSTTLLHQNTLQNDNSMHNDTELQDSDLSLSDQDIRNLQDFRNITEDNDTDSESDSESDKNIDFHTFLAD